MYNLIKYFLNYLNYKIKITKYTYEIIIKINQFYSNLIIFFQNNIISIN